MRLATAAGLYTRMASALTGGYRLAFVIGAALAVAAIGVALTVLRPERRATCAKPAYSEAV